MRKLYTLPTVLTEKEKIQLVKEGDAAFDAQVEALVIRLVQNPNLHLISLTGPTCSGKTTAAAKLKESLANWGKRVRVISLDDFYFNKDYLHELAQRNGRKELDYDSEETLDTALLHDCVESLLAGQKTQLPRFDFHTGMREAGEEIKPLPQDLFLFEGIQVLYPKVARILSKAHCQSIYICPITELSCGGEVFSPNEVRLLRRIVRDFRFRNTKPEFTLRLWKSVRENEEKSIFPYVNACQERINSSMPYELGILKPYLEEILKMLPSGSPYEADCQRMLERFYAIPVISSAYVSEKSLYKEFV